ncbi:hypothetical protein ATB98_04990 [Sinorhizobium saheli]|uniref:Uncharacterized protein n=2 Tax=Sinorhizobium saheli TaxID=36856 RepID=A0A178XWT7_SINSA|nr:hypothetical protein ATB98_04990 [Sinorhizobium saheli]
MTGIVVFHKHQEMTMTISLELQVEQLRAELKNAVELKERREIETELELVRAELLVAIAEQEGEFDAAPPF